MSAFDGTSWPIAISILIVCLYLHHGICNYGITKYGKALHMR